MNRSMVGILMTVFLWGAAPLFSQADITFRQMYGPGKVFTEKLIALEGQRINMEGYMAPPLLPELNFFILTKMPMAVCPFCEPEADWPDDLIFVRMDNVVEPVYYTRRLVVSGILELGDAVDEETGFYSRVRLVDAEFKVK